MVDSLKNCRLELYGEDAHAPFFFSASFLHASSATQLLQSFFAHLQLRGQLQTLNFREQCTTCLAPVPQSKPSCCCCRAEPGDAPAKSKFHGEGVIRLQVLTGDQTTSCAKSPFSGPMWPHIILQSTGAEPRSKWGSTQAASKSLWMANSGVPRSTTKMHFFTRVLHACFFSVFFACFVGSSVSFPSTCGNYSNSEPCALGCHLGRIWCRTASSLCPSQNVHLGEVPYSVCSLRGCQHDVVWLSLETTARKHWFEFFDVALDPSWSLFTMPGPKHIARKWATESPRRSGATNPGEPERSGGEGRVQGRAPSSGFVSNWRFWTPKNPHLFFM